MTFRPPADSTTAYRIAHQILRFFLPLLCRLKVEGRENLPTSGGCVIASNHSYGLDYFYLGYAAPRQINYMAKSEAFEGHPWLADFLRSAGVFPIRRGQRDHSALDGAVELVQSGRVVGIFPEGTRSKSGVLMRGRSGAVRIALAADAPLVPAATMNTALALRKWWNPFVRPIVTVRYGAPISLEAKAEVEEAVLAKTEADSRSQSDRAQITHHTERVMQGIAALLPRELRGEYQEV